jgi:peroxiredoxin
MLERRSSLSSTSLPFTFSYIALWGLVLFQTFLLLGVVRAVAQLQRRGSGSAAIDGAREVSLHGQEAPEFVATDIVGNRIEGSEYAGRPRALLFVSPDCRSCSITLAEMAALEWKAEGTVIVVCEASASECRVLATKYGLGVPVIVDQDRDLMALFGVSSVPTAVLIGEDDRVQSYGEPMRGEELEEMFRGREEGGEVMEPRGPVAHGHGLEDVVGSTKSGER